MHGTLCDPLGEFDIFQCPIQEVQLRVGMSVEHRKGFHGLANVDPVCTRECLQQHDEEAAGLVRVVLNGTFFTKDAKSRIRDNQDDKCDLCGERDSVLHRHWECPGLASFRAQVPPIVWEHIDSMPPCMKQRGWAVQPSCEQTFRQMLLSLPETVIPDPTMMVEGAPEPLCLFTDGTAACPNPRARYAAWAVTMVDPSDLWHNVQCSAGHLSGLVQTVPRAETRAALAALEFGIRASRPVHLWIDCQQVVDKIRGICDATYEVAPNHKDAELWREVVQCIVILTPEWVKVTKVAAHVQEAQTPLEEWAAFHNDKADRAVKWVNKERPIEFLQVHQRLVRELQLNKELVSELHQHFIRVGKAMVTNARQADPEATPLPAVTLACPPFVRPAILRTVSEAVQKKFGPTNVRYLCAWWQQVCTGERLTWVSFLQLLVDYQMATGRQGPVYSLSENKWGDPCENRIAQLPEYQVQDRVRWFRRMLLDVWRQQGVDFGLAYVRPQHTMLVSWLACVAVPWPVERMRVVEDWMGAHLSGASTSTPRTFPVASRRREMVVEVDQGIRRWMQRG